MKDLFNNIAAKTDFLAGKFYRKADYKMAQETTGMATSTAVLGGFILAGGLPAALILPVFLASAYGGVKLGQKAYNHYNAKSNTKSPDCRPS